MVRSLLMTGRNKDLTDNRPEREVINRKKEESRKSVYQKMEEDGQSVVSRDGIGNCLSRKRRDPPTRFLVPSPDNRSKKIRRKCPEKIRETVVGEDFMRRRVHPWKRSLKIWSCSFSFQGLSLHSHLGLSV